MKDDIKARASALDKLKVGSRSVVGGEVHVSKFLSKDTSTGKLSKVMSREDLQKSIDTVMLAPSKRNNIMSELYRSRLNELREQSYD